MLQSLFKAKWNGMALDAGQCEALASSPKTSTRRCSGTLPPPQRRSSSRCTRSASPSTSVPGSACPPCRPSASSGVDARCPMHVPGQKPHAQYLFLDTRRLCTPPPGLNGNPRIPMGGGWGILVGGGTLVSQNLCVQLVSFNHL